MKWVTRMSLRPNLIEPCQHFYGRHDLPDLHWNRAKSQFVKLKSPPTSSLRWNPPQSCSYRHLLYIEMIVFVQPLPFCLFYRKIKPDSILNIIPCGIKRQNIETCTAEPSKKLVLEKFSTARYGLVAFMKPSGKTDILRHITVVHLIFNTTKFIPILYIHIL